MLLLTTFLLTFVPLSLVAYCVFLGIFDAATTEIGLEHYGEKPLVSIPWLMPLNTAVNFGYVVLGLYWIYFSKKNLPTKEQFFFHIFSWFAIIYGPAQLMRFLTQSHHWAIIDQYYTLPIFAWVIPWALHYTDSYTNQKAILIEIASVLSYVLTLVTPIGFEIALGSHILLVCIIGVNCYVKHQSKDALRALILAVLNCGGFVVLKLLDLHLPKVHPFFERVSGHFLSKICDCLQIHYTLECFYAMYRTKSANEQKKR
ncbi:transmembrane protein 187-like [Lineus longissimus]|uniref:transmembrane protein 187-like n=1 Tax=Lineus longissimus TaxID=88925 RepID=UPI002B4E94A9